MVHHDVNLPLSVRSLKHESSDYISIFFERPRNFTFEPGDWIELSVPGNQPAGGTVYSLSSSPYEPDLRITFRKGLSPFKKHLASVKSGDVLQIDEYGNDRDFHLSSKRPNLLIAGGVGIAPFRSMLQNMVENSSKDIVDLIYMNTSEHFLFQAELNAWRELLPGFDIHYITTKDLKRKDREKRIRELLPGLDYQYYISGPTAMVTSTLEILKAHGLYMKSIKIDDFGPY